MSDETNEQTQPEQQPELSTEEKLKDMETRAKVLATGLYELYRFSYKRFNETRRLGATVVQKTTALHDLQKVFGAAHTALSLAGVQIKDAEKLHAEMKNPLIIA